MNPILVTGFGPFPGMPSNPSAALAREVGRALRQRFREAVRVLVMPTTYASIADLLVPALDARPAAILLLGVASRTKRIRVEVRARNRASRLYPDAGGRAAARLTLEPDAPASRRSPHAALALAQLRRHGVVARASNDAGRYLCNASYFAALARDCPAVFVHIPAVSRTRRPARVKERRAAPGATAAALAEVARRMAVSARTRGRTPPA